MGGGARSRTSSGGRVTPKGRGSLQDPAQGISHGNARLGATSDEFRALAAVYLARERLEEDLPANSLALCHLSNWAEIQNVHAGADLSQNGLSQFYGAMMNYRYRLGDAERNSVAFFAADAVAPSRKVSALIRNGRSLVRREMAVAE